MKKRMSFIGTLVIICLACVMLASCLTTLEAMAEQAMAGTGSQAGGVTNQEAIRALRDALVEGIKSAASQLSARDGYFGNAALKILLPPEAKPIVDSVSKIPQGRKLIDDVVLRLNRAAEEAAKEVVPIFTDAITSMTISDGIAIVKGGDTAATEYLEKKTRSKLFDLYRPKMDSALSKPLVADISAKKSWEILTTAYNRVGKVANSAAKLAGKKEPMPRVSVDLATYATNKGLDGLFAKIGEEEKKIRKNPLGYASAMIKKVFGALKDGLL